MSSGLCKAQTFSFSQTLHMDSIHGPAVNKEIGFRHCLRQGETNFSLFLCQLTPGGITRNTPLPGKLLQGRILIKSIFCQCKDLAQRRQHKPVRPMLFKELK